MPLTHPSLRASLPSRPTSFYLSPPTTFLPPPSPRGFLYTRSVAVLNVPLPFNAPLGLPSRSNISVPAAARLLFRGPILSYTRRVLSFKSFCKGLTTGKAREKKRRSETHQEKSTCDKLCLKCIRVICDLKYIEKKKTQEKINFAIKANVTFRAKKSSFEQDISFSNKVVGIFRFSRYKPKSYNIRNIEGKEHNLENFKYNFTGFFTWFCNFRHLFFLLYSLLSSLSMNMEVKHLSFGISKKRFFFFYRCSISGFYVQVKFKIFR